MNTAKIKGIGRRMLTVLLSASLMAGFAIPVWADETEDGPDISENEVRTLAGDTGSAQDVYYYAEYTNDSDGNGLILHLCSADYNGRTSEYEVVSTGFPQWHEGNLGDGQASWQDVIIEDEIYPATVYEWFADFDMLRNFEGGEYLNTKYTESMNMMFENANIGPCRDFIESMDVSSCTTMGNMFASVTGETDLDLSGWNLASDEVSMNAMFTKASELNSVIFPETGTTVNNVISMFNECESLTKVDISGLTITDDIGTKDDGTDYYMFCGCDAIEEISINQPSDGYIVLPETDDEYWYTEDGTGYMRDEIPASGGAVTYYAENPSPVYDEAQPVYYYWNGTDLYLTSSQEEAGNNGSNNELNINGNASPWDSATLGDGVESVSDVTSVTIINLKGGIWPSNAGYLFAGFENASFDGLEYLHTDYTTNMSHMFQNCDNLTDNDARCIEGFNTERCTDMSYMFDDAAGYIYYDAGYKSYTAISSLDLSGWDMSKVTNISSMFSNMYGAYNSLDSPPTYGITEITLPSGSFAPSPTSMTELFSGDAALKTITNIEEINTSEATSMKEVFYRCLNLDGNIDLSTWDVSNVKSMEGMFYKCEALTAIDASTWNTEKNESFKSSFYGCSSLKSIDTSNWDTSSVTDMESMFHYCEVLPNIETSGWNTANVTTIKSMFKYCYCLETVDVTNWDTSKVTDMSDVFRDCYKLHDIDVSGWDTANVIDMIYMFENCSSLTGTMDLSGWDTSRVGSTSTKTRQYGMSYMFHGCENIEVLDLSGWDTSNVWDIGSMFKGCTSLTTIYAAESQFVLNSNVTANSNYYGQNMFNGCTSLVGGNGTECDGETNTDCTMAHVDVDGNPGYFTLCEHNYSLEDCTWKSYDRTGIDNYCEVTIVCTKCGNEVNLTSNDDEVEIVYVETDPATCVSEGYNECYAVITYGNCVLNTPHDKQTLAVDPDAHEPITIPATEPTCTDPGLTEGSKCELCGTVFVEQTVIQALGHDYDWDNPVSENFSHVSEGYAVIAVRCRNCGDIYEYEAPIEIEFVYIYNNESGEYDYDNPIVVCSVKYVDPDSGEVYTYWSEAETEAAIGSNHVWVQDALGSEPTCTNDGYTVYYCTHCGATKTVVEAAKGHDWNLNLYNSSTNKNGARWSWAPDKQSCTLTFTCERCGDEHVENASIKTTFINGETVFAATVTFGGKTFQTTTTLSAQPQTSGSLLGDGTVGNSGSSSDSPTDVKANVSMLGDSTIGTAAAGSAKAQTDDAAIAEQTTETNSAATADNTSETAAAETPAYTETAADTSEETTGTTVTDNVKTSGRSMTFWLIALAGTLAALIAAVRTRKKESNG